MTQITTPKPDILEYEVKWTLGSITTNKARGGDRISAELFQILKDDTIKMLQSIYQQIWKTRSWPQDWKRSVFIPIPNKSNAKNVQTTIQLPSFHMLERLCSKSFKLSFSSKWTKRFQMYKLGFEAAEEPEIKLPTFLGAWRKQGNSRKTSTSASLTIKSLSVWITTNCVKFLKRWEYQTTWSASWEICMQDKKQQLEPDMEQQTGSKSEKEYIKAAYCHPAYLTYMQSTSCKILG